MKTLKYFSLVFLMLFSVRVMAQNEIKMSTSTVNIGEGKTYYFYDSGGDEEFTLEEDPANDYRWKTMYQHNEYSVLSLKVPSGSTKGIKVSFRSLFINNDHLRIFEGIPSDTANPLKLIVDLTNNDYSKAYNFENFSVMAHGDMTIIFSSDEKWRDAGWVATIELNDYEPQAPIAALQACADNVVLLPCSNSNSSTVKMYYTTDGTTPDANSTQYTGAFAITQAGTIVKAIMVDGSDNSSVSSDTFNTLYTAPAKPTFEYVKNTNTLYIKANKPISLNDTWYARYSKDNDPTDNADTLNGNNRVDVDTVKLTEPCTIYAVVYGTTCPTDFSAVASYPITEIYVPAPVITFEGSTNTGTATITCEWEDVDIYYTTDGSEPDENSTEYNGSFSVTAGQTVKAKTYNKNYVANSGIIPGFAANTYIPGGEGNSGAFGTIVLLDDREDHNMSYYQKAADLPAGYPTEYLSSPDPRNVKITYKGGGVSGASAVAISALSGEGQNEMIYLKTMEKTVIGMTGDYPYTVISNPFSKRPATGSGNNKTYYGFAGWKVISGGEYISEYNNNAVIPLDATIHFVNLDNNYTPNCLSAEIVFEATWTTATVKTGSSAQTFTGGTYETNFWVLTGNPSNGVTVPGNSTMTARYPDGEVSWSGNFTRAITAGGDNAKVEFVNMNSTGDVNAAGYTFTMGRGIVNSGNGGQLQGCTSNKACNHTVKIESGKYASLRHFTNDISSGNAINQLMILGCDYDRAEDDNAKLNITGSMYIANQTSLNRTAGTLYVRSIVKSGNFISATTVGNNYSGSADECYYFSGFGSNDRTGGRRYLVVEGGHLRGISGGTDIENNTAQNSSRAFELRVRGTAQIDGVVYGAAQYANGSGHRTMIFTGGTINGWIAGGANGTQQTDGATNGTSYVYVGGKTNVNSNASTTILNHAIGGNVFGAGCGYNANSTSGQVQQGTNVVIADEAYVERGVYGGGSYGYTEATANIYILGGTIDGKAGGVDGTSYDAKIPGGVYGGACQNKGGVANIIMNNGTVNGSIYGGSNSNGTLSGNVTLSITGGEVKGDVFGGGYGQNTNVAGNVNVTIGEKDAEKGPAIGARDEEGNLTEGGDVYGGGALGEVNTTAASNTTHVTINAGTMNNVYGGGLGMKGTDATTYTIYLNWSGVKAGGLFTSERYVSYTYTNASGNTVSSGNVTSGNNATITVKANTNITLTTNSSRATITARYNNQYGQQIGSANDNTITRLVNGSGAGSGSSIAANVGTVTVDINGGNMINVFGCNNLNGAPQGSVNVNFNGGEAVNVYGGGNLADYRPNTTLFPTVNISGGVVTNNVYGGGAFAKVNKTIVNMTGGEATNVYAGAQGDDKDTTLVYGNKTLNMQGGTAISVYGGSFTCQDQDYSFVNISGGRVKTHVFGSGYFGNMSGSCYVYIGENAINNAPNNNKNADKLTANTAIKLNHDKNIWIESNVYAGANWGDFQGTFGKSTIDGESNIYIDGMGYNMDQGKNNNFMIIGGSVYGSGTSSEAGATDHRVIVRNYGTMTFPSMTRSLKSIQRANLLVLDSSNIDFIGQGDISSMDPTVEYGMCNIDEIKVTNGSNMALSKPMEMVHKLGSYTCTNANGVYASTPTFTKTDYSAPKNGIVINNGGYLMVRYEENNNKIYGELEGYFFMREPGDDAGINNEGYIFARPKYVKDNGDYWFGESKYDVFKEDGGFVDFDANSKKNNYDKNGNYIEPIEPDNYHKATLESPVQMGYTNRTEEPTADRSTTAHNSTDYRFWRYEPETFPTVTREIVFVVKADKDANPNSDRFLTTEGSVQFPPALADNHKYFIQSLTWGADGKDCNPTPITKTKTDTTVWMYFDDEAAEGQEFATKAKANLTDEDLEEYYANPNSSFGFLMHFGGNFKTQTDKILDRNSYAVYYKDKAHALAEVDGSNTTALPQLDFQLTYSDRLSQNELWSEATMVIDEVEEYEEEIDGVPVTKYRTKQRIYLNISVTTITKFGSNVETSVYASTAGTAVSTYQASLALPTFMLADPNDYYATFKVGGTDKSTDFGKVSNTTTISIASIGHVEGTTDLALEFKAVKNGDNTDGWNNKGNAQNPNQAVTYDYNTVATNSLLGASDGRKYTTIQFELQYDPTELATVNEFKLGQKYLGDLIITMNVDNVQGGVNSFDIIVHVYVTGPSKYFYLDGVAGRDGNSGMFPDDAKKTLAGVITSNGYTVNDPIFVVNGVAPKSNGTLTWDASQFADKGQVKVYRYPGNHPRKNGDSSSTGFNNGINYKQMIDVPENTSFSMKNVYLNGGSNMPAEYIPLSTTIMHSDYPLISIAQNSTVTINNSSLVANNNTSETALAGAIYNKGILIIDGVRIDSNSSKGKGTGVYHSGEKMELGNTDAIVINDQVYLDDQKIMEAPHGFLYEGSLLKDILVYNPDSPNPIDAKYSGRVIVRYPNNTPTAPEAPFWKTLVNGEVPQNQSSILKNHKAAGYESDKYGLNEDEIIGFSKANGGDNNVLPYITDEMKAETYAPITNHDIIMYSTKANLPVELLYFTAECMGEATQLQWSTASETNNEYFTIERSSNAVNYEEVARIQGAGTTSQRSDYSFMVDNNSTAITYYRLRQTDIDGKYEIFAPIAIQCQNNKAATEISIYPVPANDQV
ncbi:MAG: chitobiase/beta-hexosaminidase C-terminal domain-containing protein, partial [Bacteroidales bacterium]|nr:chitobiase/beta-hexosaminidase C-terminal domain-containing protein [Bacteroidales bacterium]